MKKEKLLKILKANFDNVMEDYSGRYMYGRTCLAVSVPTGIIDLVDIVPKAVLQKAKIDQMGLGYVVYFPSIT